MIRCLSPLKAQLLHLILTCYSRVLLRKLMKEQTGKSCFFDSYINSAGKVFLRPYKFLVAVIVFYLSSFCKKFRVYNFCADIEVFLRSKSRRRCFSLGKKFNISSLDLDIIVYYRFWVHFESNCLY